MKYTLFSLATLLLLCACQSNAHKDPKSNEQVAPSAGYQIGDEATDFSLKDVTGEMVSLAQFPEAKGFILIFTCNHCPYSIAYEDRIIDLQNEFGDSGYPVIAINPNDPAVQPDDSYEKMQERAEEKNFNFPYLMDEGQKIYPQYGATRTPHVFILKKEDGKNIVKYIGAIDNNHEDADDVSEYYVKDAVTALLQDEEPEPHVTKAIGCSIKASK